MRAIGLLLPAMAWLSLSCRDTGPATEAPPRARATPRHTGVAGARSEPKFSESDCLDASDLNFVVEPSDPDRRTQNMMYGHQVRVHGDKLYYNGMHSLYSMPLSGGQATEIYSDTAETPIQNFFVRDNDYLIIHGEYQGTARRNTVSRVPMGDTRPDQVRDLVDNTNVSSLIYQDDTLYASVAPRALYSLNLKTGERTDFGSITLDDRPWFVVDDGIMLITDYRGNREPVKLFSILLSDNSVSDYMLSPMPAKLSVLGATGGHFYYSAPTDPESGGQIRRAPLTGGASEVVADVPETVWGDLAVSEAGLAFVGAIPPLRVYWQPTDAPTPRELACMGNTIRVVENIVLHDNVLYAVVGLGSPPLVAANSWGIIRRPLE